MLFDFPDQPRHLLSSPTCKQLFGANNYSTISSLLSNRVLTSSQPISDQHCFQSINMVAFTTISMILGLTASSFAVPATKREENTSGNGVWCNTEQGTPGYGNW